jgi:hypothetical protein
LRGGDRLADHSRSQDAIHVSARGFGGGLVPRMDLVAAQRIASRLDVLSTAPDGTGQFVFDRDAKLLCWDHDGRGDAPAIRLRTFPRRPAGAAAKWW